jgi:hypothetical protein
MANKPWGQYVTFNVLTVSGFMTPIMLSCILYVMLICSKKRKFMNQVTNCEMQSKSLQENKSKVEPLNGPVCGHTYSDNPNFRSKNNEPEVNKNRHRQPWRVL